ncbi:hypothetical protein [Longimicrobium terrae]|uniref:S9 family peptidase n=1 Tax=Longimicrobium terrae TaxID=1639882 RepID=A0A841H4V3_9BACT|nr:hypothetical protein [Longimicrobium terrae]MBB4638922.1 hypothetical protein [Longimicrobium terrae]MBB6073161.1 hypothetical protein [Longimicrobium terrae]NNC30153.1 hypothetical protein [Longimicrobium terrae]
MRLLRPLALLGALLSLNTCRLAQAQVVELPPGVPLRRVQPVVSAEFGGAVRGRVVWLSANGRMAAIYRFTRDTDGDGRVEPRMGIHGEMLGDRPDLWLYDLADGDSAVYDDLLAGDGAGRYMALLRGGRPVLLDSHDGEAREMAELQGSPDDGNRCMTPRQFSFSDDGRRLAYLRGDPAELVVRTLATGGERVVRAGQGVLWRAGLPADTGWTLLMETDPPATAADSAAFPVQLTSCASLASNLFASSYSYSGWEGARFRTVLVGADGVHHPVAGYPVTLGEKAYAVPDSARLFSAAGEAIALPAGCTELSAVPGVARVVLRCGDHSAIFDPVTRAQIHLPVTLYLDDRWLGGVMVDGAQWIAALVLPDSIPRGTPTVYRLARLRMEDGRLETGPEVQVAELAQDPEWLVGYGPGDVYALSLRTGRVRTLTSEAEWLRGFLVGQDDARLVLNPDRGAYIRTGETASDPSPAGCVLEAASTDHRTETGPWTRRCVP